MQAAWRFLLDLSSGEEKRIPSATRQKARDIVKHYPYPGSIQEYWSREVDLFWSRQPLVDSREMGT